ncbi:hypothetical protein CR970_02290 [Candidatus Saccharibacteria bacterium]|nr:MAG: hypothetical protein CR970_02290 [Candidatus Saccharibacteria bacterium]
MDPQQTSNGTSPNNESAQAGPAAQPGTSISARPEASNAGDSGTQTAPASSGVSAVGNEVKATPTTPSGSAASASAPGVNSSQPSAPASTQQPSEAGATPPARHGFKFGKRKLVALVAGLVVLMMGSSAAAYFGYLVPNKPENIWAAAMERTADGIDAMVADSRQDIDKPMELSGKFRVSAGEGDGGLATDGTYSVRSDGESAVMTADFSVITSRINTEVRLVDSPSSDYPDVYFKAGGLDDLAPLLPATPDMAGVDSLLGEFNDQWINIDHSLIDNVIVQSGGGTEAGQSLGAEEVYQISEAINSVNREYLFTDDAEKAVFKIAKNVGREERDGRSVYHYQVVMNKQNVKKYLEALGEKLDETPAKKFLDDGSFKDKLKDQDLFDAIDKYDENSAFADVYIDLATKTFHTIRFTDKDNEESYIELGVRPTNDKELPFVFKFVGDDESELKTIDFSLNYDRQQRTWNSSIKATGTGDGFGDEEVSLELTMDAKHIDGDFKVEKPADAKSINHIIGQISGLAAGGDEYYDYDEFGDGIDEDFYIDENIIGI